jgi:hypothetical protein
MTVYCNPSWMAPNEDPHYHDKPMAEINLQRQNEPDYLCHKHPGAGQWWKCTACGKIGSDSVKINQGWILLELKDSRCFVLCRDCLLLIAEQNQKSVEETCRQYYMHVPETEPGPIDWVA